MRSITVITPTVGNNIEILYRCLLSIQKQDYEGILEHYVVIDGVEGIDNVKNCIKQLDENLLAIDALVKLS